MSKEIILSDADFDANVLKSELPVLVDFWAPWCGPCRFVGPILTRLAEEKADKLKIGKLNVDDNAATAQRFGISSIPTMMLFKDGKPIETLIGAMPKEAIEQALDKHL